jgi:hypothetical protein
MDLRTGFVCDNWSSSIMLDDNSGGRVEETVEGGRAVISGGIRTVESTSIAQIRVTA